MANTKFTQLAGVLVHYDRRFPGDYGTKGEAADFFAEKPFIDQLDDCFNELWTISGLGSADVVTSAGAFVDRPRDPGDRHSLARAFDLDGIFWSNRVFVTLEDGFKGGDKKFYFGVNAILCKYFGVVLNYLYNSDHRDHFHLDDSRSVGFDPNARSKVLFLQGALVHVVGISVGPTSTVNSRDIDGEFGPNTDRAVKQALSKLGISGNIATKSVWLQFLTEIARQAFGSPAISPKSITIIQPSNNQQLPFASPVKFAGTADAGVATVKLLAEDKFDVGKPITVNSSGNWSTSYKFTQAGTRRIIAKGFDAGGNQVARNAIDITLQTQSGGYNPPTLSSSRLGTILSLLAGATQVDDPFLGSKVILKLSNGELYIDADMDIDADGSPNAQIIDPCCGQLQTSLRYPNGDPVDSEKVPYFVLPNGFFKSKGIELGDIAAVVYKDKVEYAVFADVGPATKIGEGSIALARFLGHEPLIDGVVKSGIEEDVLYIIFPGSGDGTPQTIDSIQDKGEKLFKAIGGKP